jgi:hypothetical protein
VLGEAHAGAGQVRSLNRLEFNILCLFISGYYFNGMAHAEKKREVSEMNQFDRAMIKAEEESMPQLRVVAKTNGAAKKSVLPPPLRFPARPQTRQNRPELAVLGWEPRDLRLMDRKRSGPS